MNAKEKTHTQTINIPSQDGTLPIYAGDLMRIFNFRDKLIISEFLLTSTNSFNEIGIEFAKILDDNDLTKIAVYIVASDVSGEDVSDLTQHLRHIKHDLQWGIYDPKDGECNRVVTIMQ